MVDYWKHCPLVVMETCVSNKGCFDDGWYSRLEMIINHSICEGSYGATEVVMQHPVSSGVPQFVFVHKKWREKKAVKLQSVLKTKVAKENVVHNRF